MIFQKTVKSFSGSIYSDVRLPSVEIPEGCSIISAPPAPLIPTLSGLADRVRQDAEPKKRLTFCAISAFKPIGNLWIGGKFGSKFGIATQYYLLHRAFFGLDVAPAGACILYANGCGLNETALKLVWGILEQGGSRTIAAKENGEEEDESKGNEYRLVDWRVRAQRDGLGESRAGQPAPIIDRLHRLMFLLSTNRATEVQENFENWGLAAEPVFLPLIQALHSLADRERRAEEKKLIEALAAQLKLNRRTGFMPVS